MKILLLLNEQIDRILQTAKNFLKQRFEAEKTGDQTLFTERSKLLKPLIESQKETSKSIQDKIATSQDTISNVLVLIYKSTREKK